MTTPNTSRSGDSEFAMVAWFEANRRALSIAFGVIVAVAVGGWFYLRSAEIKRGNAERGLAQAKQSIASGNQALAMSDLQRVATRFVGTPAGASAAMLLAQVNYNEAKFEEGLKALDTYKTSRAAGPALPEIFALAGDGHISMARPDSAAVYYSKAAEAARLPGLRAAYLARTARALMMGGRDQEARAIWERLAAEPDAAIVKAEAEIRLGELAARPAGSP